jgi:hypothetical protein
MERGWQLLCGASFSRKGLQEVVKIFSVGTKVFGRRSTYSACVNRPHSYKTDRVGRAANTPAAYSGGHGFKS